MNRPRWAFLALVVLITIGLRWVYPRLSRTSVRFEVRPAPCAQTVSIAIFSAGRRVKSLQVMAAKTGPAAVYETKLHAGRYEVGVSLDCTDGEVKDGRPFPVDIDREANDTTIRLSPPRACVCDP